MHRASVSVGKKVTAFHRKPNSSAASEWCRLKKKRSRTFSRNIQKHSKQGGEVVCACVRARLSVARVPEVAEKCALVRRAPACCQTRGETGEEDAVHPEE